MYSGYWEDRWKPGDRPAPQQVSKPAVDLDAQEGDYNIWYHKRPGQKRGRDDGTLPRGVKSPNRCIPIKHSGKTRGATPDTCLYFARGGCHLGHRCGRRHRLPMPSDEPDTQVDTFGRRRGATEGDDNNGVGSVFVANCTLWVVNIAADCTEESVRRDFSEFGPVQHVRHFAHKGFTFVQYYMRASAEFAKEAMANQVIRGTEPVLSVRWAREDPNPRVIEMLKKRRQNAVANHVANADGAAYGAVMDGDDGDLIEQRLKRLKAHKTLLKVMPW